MLKDRKLAMLDSQRTYNKRILVQKPKDREGPHVPLDEFEDFIHIYADEKYLRGKPFFSAKSPNIQIDKEYIVRYREDLTENMRIIDKDTIYEIDSILPLDNEKLNLIIRVNEIKKDLW